MADDWSVADGSFDCEGSVKNSPKPSSSLASTALPLMSHPPPPPVGKLPLSHHRHDPSDRAIPSDAHGNNQRGRSSPNAAHCDGKSDTESSIRHHSRSLGGESALTRTRVPATQLTVEQKAAQRSLATMAARVEEAPFGGEGRLYMHSRGLMTSLPPYHVPTQELHHKNAPEETTGESTFPTRVAADTGAWRDAGDESLRCSSPIQAGDGCTEFVCCARFGVISHAHRLSQHPKSAVVRLRVLASLLSCFSCPMPRSFFFVECI